MSFHRSDQYCLIKFFAKQEFAEQFLNGNLYLNSLDYFRSASQEDPNKAQQNRQNDIQEGSIFLNRKLLKEKHLWQDLGDVLAYDPVFILDEYKYCHVFCCSTVDRLGSKFETVNPHSMQDCGEYAVLIYDVPEFQARASKNFNSEQGMKYIFGRVTYHKPKLDGSALTEHPKHTMTIATSDYFSLHDIQDSSHRIYDCFDKRWAYAHQREWRMWLYRKNWDTSPYQINIGNLKDIAQLVTTDSLEAFFSNIGNLKRFQLQNDRDYRYYGNINRRDLRKTIIETNPLGKLAYTIG